MNVPNLNSINVASWTKKAVKQIIVQFNDRRWSNFLIDPDHIFWPSWMCWDDKDDDAEDDEIKRRREQRILPIQLMSLKFF